MNPTFTHLQKPTTEYIEALNRWENDPAIVKRTKPNPEKQTFQRVDLTLESVSDRFDHHEIFLISLDGTLIGEMNYMIDPGHLYKKEPGTAWIGITIGEEYARGKGIGAAAIHYLEEQIRQSGLNRIELGVFEFNTQAHKLYQKLGYTEISRIEAFTYADGQMWADIRMEKYLD